MLRRADAISLHNSYTSTTIRAHAFPRGLFGLWANAGGSAGWNAGTRDRVRMSRKGTFYLFTFATNYSRLWYLLLLVRVLFFL